jgi:hypothetical protein
VWAIDPWSRLSRQPAVRSPEFGLAGSERTWALSYTHDKLGFHLTCVGEALRHAGTVHCGGAWQACQPARQQPAPPRLLC